MIKKTIFAMAMMSWFYCVSQVSNPYYLGHSLVNFDMPAMVQGLAEDAAKTTDYDSQIGIGAPLVYNYNNYGTAQGTPYVDAFPAGDHDAIIITEAVPLQNHLSYSDTYLYSNMFFNYAKSNNNSNPVKFYMYETWHCINSGIPSEEENAENGCMWDNSENSTLLWHPRLLADFSLWTGIVSNVRDENPGDTEIWLVPGGQAFHNLATEINEGNVPGITEVTDLFSDDIHLTNAGNYFIACVMYATIYKESPEGLTQSINNQWGSPFTDMPTNDQALIMQEIAWETVSGLTQWTGVSSTVPVDWMQNTDAALKDDGVLVSFATANQINNSHFEIEHSLDGREFNIIGKINGGETTSNESLYEFFHRSPIQGENFYRVKQVDYDGKFTYGNVASIDYISREISIYPNPVSGDLIVYSSIKDFVTIRNQLGQEVSDQEISSGINKMDLTSLNSGIYFAQFRSGIVKRIVKK